MQLAQAELISEPPGTPGTPGADPTIWDQIERILLPVTQIATTAAKTITDLRAQSDASRAQAALIAAAQQRAAAGAGVPFTNPVFGMSGSTMLLIGAAGLAVYMLAKKGRR